MAETIDLRGSDTPLPFFEAGVYPRNFRGLENYDCELIDKSLRFILPDGKEVEIDAKVTRVGVYENDKISYIQAYTDYISLDEAFEQSAAVHHMIGKDTDGLQAYLEKVRENWIYPKAKYGVMTEGNPRLIASFLPGAYQDRPLRFVIKIEWFRPPPERKVRTIPIKPPPGYEHISMDPAPHPGIKRSEADQGREPAPQEEVREKVDAVEQKQPFAGNETIPVANTFSWRWFGFVAIVLALLILFAFKLRLNR